MKLIITIDTEEDNWGNYTATGSTVENINRIPSLQQLFDDFNVRPTYLVTYPVAINEKSILILREIVKEGKCEIGTHCHPWNTPPFGEETSLKNSMLCNLPVDLQYRKMRSLHETIRKHLCVEPVSFRSGRWGYNHNVATNLYRLGYKIDTSVTPYTDWTNDFGPDFARISPHPFWISNQDGPQPTSIGNLLEVPATIGFLGYNFTMNSHILKILKREPINRLRLIGFLDRLKLLNKVWLSPEASDSKSMIKLTQRMMSKNYRLINLVFHSSSLKVGLTPFVRTQDDEKRLFQRLKEFLTFASHAGIESIVLSDALKEM